MQPFSPGIQGKDETDVLNLLPVSEMRVQGLDKPFVWAKVDFPHPPIRGRWVQHCPYQPTAHSTSYRIHHDQIILIPYYHVVIPHFLFVPAAQLTIFAID
ncbi:MAG: hypothetical protein WCO52_04335 [bacterium]